MDSLHIFLYGFFTGSLSLALILGFMDWRKARRSRKKNCLPRRLEMLNTHDLWRKTN